MDQFSTCWELVHWHFRFRLVLQTILMALDPQMVRVRKCVWQIRGPSASARKSADPGPWISAVRTPLPQMQQWKYRVHQNIFLGAFTEFKQISRCGHRSIYRIQADIQVWTPEHLQNSSRYPGVDSGAFTEFKQISRCGHRILATNVFQPVTYEQTIYPEICADLLKWNWHLTV